MTGMENIERELAGMKCDTLCRLGRKVEIAVEMLAEEERFCKRLKGIVFRLKSDLAGGLGWRKRRRYTHVLERAERKLAACENKIVLIEEAKEKAVSDYKMQREILGLTDHTFIDGYLRNPEHF